MDSKVNYRFLQPPVNSSPLGPNILLTYPDLNNPKPLLRTVLLKSVHDFVVSLRKPDLNVNGSYMHVWLNDKK
jgi:hypothetical protein